MTIEFNKMIGISKADTFTVCRVAFMLLLLYKPQLSDGVTCYKTEGPSITTCEIQPEQDRFCFLDCVIDHSGNYHCFLDCINQTLVHCRNNITTINFISFCCTTSYCNILNDSSLAHITAGSNSPTESTKAPNDDNDDDNVIVDVVIALGIGVVLVVVTLTLLTVLIMCHWRRWKKNQLRQRAAMVIN